MDLCRGPDWPHLYALSKKSTIPGAFLLVPVAQVYLWPVLPILLCLVTCPVTAVHKPAPLCSQPAPTAVPSHSHSVLCWGFSLGLKVMLSAPKHHTPAALRRWWTPVGLTYLFGGTPQTQRLTLPPFSGKGVGKQIIV